MTALGFQWVRPPTQMARRIEDYGDRVLVAVQAAAAYVGEQMQNQARANAPWTDRTGNARSGLFYAVDGLGLNPLMGRIQSVDMSLATDTVSVSGDKDHLVLLLGHTVFYGKWLEVSNGAKYAIVMSTVEANLGALERALHRLLK